MKIVQVCLCGSYNPFMGYQDVILPRYYEKLGLECVTIASQYYKSEGRVIYENFDSQIDESIRIIRLKGKLPYKINRKVRWFEGIYDVLEQEKPDIIFLHNFQFVSILQVLKYCKENQNVKVYADSHTDYINSMHSWVSKYIFHQFVWRRLVKKMEPFVIKFWGVTELRCEFMEKVYHISPQKIDLLVMGADGLKFDLKEKDKIRDNIRKQYNLRDTDFVIVTGGKIDEKKQVHKLVNAVGDLNDKNIKLMIFGKIEKDMEQYFREINYENIIQIGWINSDKVYDYFMAADLAVFPGTHSVLWEQAVGTGLPCIFKYWKGMSHVNVGGNCLFLYDNIVEELKEKIACLKEKGEIYKEMKKQSEEKGIAEFSYLEIAKRSIQL